MNSKSLCRITGMTIVIAQCCALVAAIHLSINPIEYAYGFSLWGVFVAIPLLNSK